MMRILAMADTQIGVGTVTLADQRDVLDKIVALALQREVDIVIHGGDVFEGPVVTPEHIRLFLDATQPLRDWKIPIVVLRGNGRHDMAVRSVHALDVFSEIDGFVVMDRPRAVSVKGVDVVGLPWVHPGRLTAVIDSDRLDHDDVNVVASDGLLRIARGFIDKTNAPRVLVAHWAISGARLPTGLPVDEMREPILPWADLDALGYDAIIGAHIHEPQEIFDRRIDQTVGFVVGSPQQLNHGEHGEHGVWTLDLADTAEALEFIPIGSRQFVTVELNEQNDQDIPEGAIVRVRGMFSEEEARALDHNEIRASLAAAGASRVDIRIDVERETRARVEINDTVDTVDAMRLYCDANEIDDPMREQLLTTIKDWSSE